MFKLLNRISIFLSIFIGFFVTLSLAILIDEVDFDSDTFLVWGIFIAIFSVVCKQLFLSKSFILDSLQIKQEKIFVEEDKKVFENDLSVASVRNIKDDKNVVAAQQQVKNKLNNQVYAEPLNTVVAEKEILKNDFEKPRITEKNKVESFNMLEPAINNDNLKKESGFFQKFFAENVLAKIGGILLFLSVLFLLQLVYNKVGPVEKLMIGFVVGFLVFGVGVYLEKKSFGKEARVLLGISILINYLVILAGRYLIDSNLFDNSKLLSEEITLFLLILNTVFAVLVSIIYNSNTLLFFSFVAAYLNPFLMGAEDLNTPYTYLSYGLCISFGILILVNLYKNKFKSCFVYLSYISFLGANIIFLAAPFSNPKEWILKLASIGLVSLFCILNAYFNDRKKEVFSYFFGTYLFFSFLLFSGDFQLGSFFVGFDITISYLLFLFLMVFGSVYFFIRTSFVANIYNLIFPLIILLVLMETGILEFQNIFFVLIAVVVLYLGFFVLLWKDIPKNICYSFFVMLGVFILAVSLIVQNSFFDIETKNNVFSIWQNYGVMFSALLFLFAAYCFSFVSRLESLYFFASVFCVSMLLPVLSRGDDLRLASIVTVLFFAFFNIFLPFVNNLLIVKKKNIGSLIFGLLSGVLFLVGEVYYFLFADMGFSKITLGLVFMMMAVLYFILTYAMFLRIKIMKKAILLKNEKFDSFSFQNILYSFLGISISLFSLAVAYVFSDNSEFVTLIWLFESSVLFYFYQRTKDFRIFLGAFLLMLIGVWNLGLLIPMIKEKDYLSFIPLFISFIAVLFSLYFMKFEKKWIRYLYDFLHVLFLFLFCIVIEIIVPLNSAGVYIFGFSIFMLICSVCYSLFFSSKIRYYFILLAAFLFLNQTNYLEMFFDYADDKELGVLKYLHYMATIMFALAVYAFNVVPKKLKSIEFADKWFLYILNFVSIIYFFVITTEYVYFLFAENPFTITIYWGLAAFLFLSYGISKDLIRYRTSGLYILFLTLLKIVLYDIWSSLDDAILRVVALMFVGVLMIVVSLLYTRKYGGRLKGEFDFENLKK